jgi:hypothetical protein
MFGATIVLVSACSKPAPVRELQRKTSSDQVLDLVLVESGGDFLAATVSTTYQVFVVRRGEVPTADDEPVLRVDRSSQPLTIAWTGPGAAAISCEVARVWRFSNFASVRLSGEDFVSASIRLDCGQQGYKQH